MWKTIILTFCVVQTFGFQSGKYYILTNTVTDHVVTVSGKDFNVHNSIVAQPWIGHDSQVWLALLENQRLGRSVSGPDRFILVPKRQSWDWNERTGHGAFNISVDTLPQGTVVLSLHATEGNLTQEVYNDGSSQKWITTIAKDGDILLENLGNQQCVKNFDYKSPNFIQMLRKRIENLFSGYTKRVPSPLGTLTCNKDDLGQRWKLEPVEEQQIN